MQTPPNNNNQNSGYEQRGFTAVPAGGQQPAPGSLITPRPSRRLPYSSRWDPARRRPMRSLFSPRGNPIPRRDSPTRRRDSPTRRRDRRIRPSRPSLIPAAGAALSAPAGAATRAAAAQRILSKRLSTAAARSLPAAAAALSRAQAPQLWQAQSGSGRGHRRADHRAGRHRGIQLLGNRQTRTAYVSAGTLGSNYTGDALIVRNEVMYTQEGISQIDYVANEGEVVTRGSDVCTVYTSGFNTREWATLNNYRTQIKEYQKTLLAETNVEADSQLKRFNSSVLERAQETQSLVQGKSGNLINQEELLSDIINERSYYLKQKYSDDQKLSRLYDDEKTQLQRIETWTKPFVAADPGIISFYTDGYERVLSSQTYDSFTPAEVRSMYKGNLPKSAALGRNEVAVYRLVRQGGYTVLMLCDDVNWTPTVGASYELLVESFDNTRVSATVESVTRSEGELLVRLSVVGDVSPVLYIRSCHVQLSESIYSLTVPANAITTVDGEMGVVVVQPDGNYFLPVTIISQDSNEAHIVPQLSNILSVGSVVLVF